MAGWWDTWPTLSLTLYLRLTQLREGSLSTICESDGAVPCEQREPEVAPLGCAMQTRPRQGRRWEAGECSQRLPHTFPVSLGKHAWKQNWNHSLCRRCASSVSRKSQPDPYPPMTPAHTSSLTIPHSETPQLSQAENDLNFFWHLNPPP